MISVIAPIERAFAWMKQVLFSPFDIEKWCVLGFCAFLASLAEGGFGFHGPMGRDDGPSWEQFDRASEWITGHLPLVIIGGALLVLLALAIGLLCLWIGSRGQFMFLDGVVGDRAAVVEPWRRFRDLGNDLFIFRVQLAVCALLALALLGYLAWMMMRPDLAARHFGSASLRALLLVGGPTLLLLLALGVVSLLLGDFVVPVMYRRGIGTGQAFGVLWREIIPGHLGAFVLYFLMKALMTLGAVLVILGTCCVCCLAALPYIGSVVLLPLSVFFRAYSLRFLEQFGEEWILLGLPEPLPAAEEG